MENCHTKKIMQNSFYLQHFSMAEMSTYHLLLKSYCKDKNAGKQVKVPGAFVWIYRKFKEGIKVQFVFFVFFFLM